MKVQRKKNTDEEGFVGGGDVLDIEVLGDIHCWGEGGFAFVIDTLD
jgi:hypothetical protein